MAVRTSENFGLSPGNAWLIIGVVGSISIYWYNSTFKTKPREKRHCDKPGVPPTPEEVLRRKEMEHKRLEAVDKLQKQHEILSIKAEEKRRKRRDEELAKRLALIEYLDSSARSSAEMELNDPCGPPKTITNEISAKSTGDSSSTQILKLNTTTDNENEVQGYAYGLEPEEDFISDFEFEYNMAHRNGGGPTRNLICSAGVNGISREVVIDTGASFTIINERLARVGRLQRVPSSLGLVGANGQSMEVLGAIKITISVGDGFTVQHNALVSPNLPANLLLGCDFHSRHGLQVDFSTNTLKFSNGNPVEFSVN